MYDNEFKTKGNKFKLRIKLSHHIIPKRSNKTGTSLAAEIFWGYIISIQISISFYRMTSLFSQCIISSHL